MTIKQNLSVCTLLWMGFRATVCRPGVSRLVMRCAFANETRFWDTFGNLSRSAPRFFNRGFLHGESVGFSNGAYLSLEPRKGPLV